MALALIALAVILVLAIKGLSKPFLAVLAFVLLYELQPGELFPSLNVLHLERIMILLVLTVFMVKGIKFRYPPITQRLLWFYGAMIFSSLFAFWRVNSFLFDLKFLEIVLYHLFLVAVLTSEDRVKKYIFVYTALVAWISLSSLYDYLHGDLVYTMHIDRAFGLTSAGGDPDTMAQTIVLAMPLSMLFLARGTSKWLKLYAIGTLGLYLLTVIDTGSRTQILAFVVFVMLVLFRKPKNLKYLPLVLVAMLFLWTAIPQQYKARYETIKTRDQDGSYTNRLLSWQGGVKMFLHNPITGIGPQNYTDANGLKYWPRTPRHWLNAHSLYFKLLGELGLVGIFTFAPFMISVMRMNWRLSHEYRDRFLDPVVKGFPAACNQCYILLLFSGYASHNLYRVNWYTLAAITASLALLQPAEAKLRKSEEKPAKRRPAWVPAKQEIGSSTVTTV